MKKTEMAATIENQADEIKQLDKFRIAVANALQRPDWRSLESLTRYVVQDIAYLQKENQRLQEQIIMYKRSFEVGDDR